MDKDQQPEPISAWHRILQQRDISQLEALLADDAVFYSPIVFKPQPGRQLVCFYLSAALKILVTPQFRYVSEICGERQAALEFVTELEGIQVNGVDLIRWNDRGLISEFKVMLRPLKAINLVHRLMGAELQAMTARDKGQDGDLPE